MAERNGKYQDAEEYKTLYNAFEAVVKIAKEKSRGENWYEYLEHLQCGGKLCEHNCVLCTLLWICHHKLGLFPCGRQLEKLLIWYAGKKITDTRDLQCDQLINIVTKCEIAEQCKDYDYNAPESTRTEMINKVWKDITAFQVPRVRLLLLARWHLNDNGIGHCVVCDLEKTTKDQKHFLIYDPQAESGQYMDRKKFKDYVENDGGLSLYTVDPDVLHAILFRHWKNLHLTSDTIPTLPNVELPKNL